MSTVNQPRVRYSIRHLQDEYDKGNKKPLEDLVRAWKGIQALPPTDKRSFFVLGGYHGEPFQYRKQVDALDDTDRYVYWGGFCNHGNILFPTWHRVYVWKLEEALRTISPDVTMPYWDETDEESLNHGIPSILTQEKFELDGELIDNPLRSFKLPEALSDYAGSDERAYEKPKSYQTVRYPLSGLVGTAKAREATTKHNDKYRDPESDTQLLNENIAAWLNGREPTRNPDPKNPCKPPEQNKNKHGVYWKFKKCLLAPNYVVFSNTTSAAQWNLDHRGKVTALESPHNDIHLAVGGFDMRCQGEAGLITGSNGDMGENNTAGMDPIFFFHHTNIDRMFWLWQKQHKQTDELTMDGDWLTNHYPGTTSSDSQGPTPGIAPGTGLSLDTPLNPFVKDEFGNVFTTRDCVNIETQLGYTYAPGSFDEDLDLEELARSVDTPKKLTVSGIDRALFQGSFLLQAFATVTGADGKETEYYLGHHSVLSRWNVVKCANCLTHLEVIAHFPLHDPELLRALDDIENGRTGGRVDYHIEIQHRGVESLTPSRVPLNAVSRIDSRTEGPALSDRFKHKFQVRA